jgi:single-strand DNA-binding protein
MINKVILLGRLGADPEIGTTSLNAKFAKLSLATNRSWKEKDGEKKTVTTWNKIKVFDPNLATTLEKYASKGTMLYVEGELDNRSYKDSNDVQRFVTEVLVPRVRGQIRLISDTKKSVDGKDEDANTDAEEPFQKQF